MKYSVVMTSYLGEYKNSAKNKDVKFKRAVDSLLQQTYKDFELIIVADGCTKTIELTVDNYSNEIKQGIIRLIDMPKNKETYGAQRQVGIEYAKGEYITYLDTDDKLTNDHLEIIDSNIGDNDVVYYNDFVFGYGNKWIERNCELIRNRCGTSNITHRKDIGKWRDTGYSHDWHFIQSLYKGRQSIKKIKTPGYLVCHIPRSVTGIGYDV